ncbi:MAG TPA: DNA mismatch repair protein MutS [Methanoregula sp.]|nr:DNA mismatch repair protein MutS [Methanoregula sp.]
MTSDQPAESSGDTDNSARLTPVMRQYREIKEKYPDSILFFRIGDFYETFERDAELISRELDIVLTSRSKSGENRIPLAGVPFHAADGYIAKLVSKGYKVAVVDQVGDTKNTKGIVKRELVRVITPGTVIDSTMLSSSAPSFLLALCPDRKNRQWGMAFLDISTGEFFTVPADYDPGFENILSEVARYRPAECIIPSEVPSGLAERIRERGIAVTHYRDEGFSEQRARQNLMDHFHVASLAGFGCEEFSAAVCAGGAALAYAKETQNAPLAHIRSLSTRSQAQGLILDAITLRNLEVKENIRLDPRGATLFSCLDLTKTPMGSRMLVNRLSRPLTNPDEINKRLDAISFLIARTPRRLELRTLLTRCADIERIAGRIAYGNAGPRDLVTLAASLEVLPEIRTLLQDSHDDEIPSQITGALEDLRDVPDLIGMIGKAIVEDPPAIARNGGVIRPGYSKELDSLKGVLHSGKDWIVRLQEIEQQKTGIKSLKIGYNRIFGYYIDITKPNLHLVPSHYQRRQTTATGERYTLPELQEKETLITNADERILALERELYAGIIEILRTAIPDLQATARGISVLDVSASLAEIAQVHDYVRPQLNRSDAIIIRDGRHPVVEQGVSGVFVPNDTELASSGTQVMIITGANMAGKSTFMRAVALICIMAQAGCYVPARYASIGVLDRIFTRVGAFDDLASGQSTFFVEMLELANILNNVTVRSLVILDEIGRGTSTADGHSIAKAVLEYLHGRAGAGPKTLFATHFHELVEVEGSLKRVKNYHFAVKETNNEVIFLRKLICGATDKSYGIHVARLAGIPKKVTDRADAILNETMNRDVPAGTRPQRYTQILLVDNENPIKKPVPDPVLDHLAHINTDEMTPMQALAKIAELQKMLEKKEKQS